MVTMIAVIGCILSFAAGTGAVLLTLHLYWGRMKHPAHGKTEGKIEEGDTEIHEVEEQGTDHTDPMTIMSEYLFGAGDENE